MILQRSLIDTLNETDRRTRALLDDLSEDQLDVPYHRCINPPLWELGHCAFFYEFFLLRQLGNSHARMPGYDEMWDSFAIQHSERWRKDVVPDSAKTKSYYRQIVQEMRGYLESHELTPLQQYLCLYVMHHQHMHIESLIHARQTLGYPAPGCCTSTENRQHSASDLPSLGDAKVPAGHYPIGLPAGDPCAKNFCFDNEKPQFEKWLEAFHISKTLVSCGEYLRFIEDGGYEKTDHWSYGGRHWLRESKLRTPLYWKKENDHWRIKRFDQWHELCPSHPMLHVSYWEAEAYCHWAGRRLPSEYEWEAAARGKEGLLFPWGDAMDSGSVDMNGERMGQVRVDDFPEAASPFGCLQMIGTAWEWTSNQYLPYDGFCVDMYPYMSTLQFGDHKTTRGGSCATSSCLIRSTYRQAYFPSRSDAFTGFRTCAL